MVVVGAPREKRSRWLMSRSGMTREQVEKIKNTQASSEERKAVAHEFVNNDGSLDDLLEEVDRLHAKYLVMPKLVR